jgi:hypothetical protein
MKKIGLDTNFLIDIIRFKVDLKEIDFLIGERYEFFILSSVLKELEKLSKRKSEYSKFAKIALKLIEQKNFKIIKTEEKSTDESLVKFADKNTIIATNDIELRKRLKRLRIQTIYLRARKHLDID